MIVAWMFSSIVIAALVGVAALCVERVLTLRRGMPLRMLWIAAIVGALGWSAIGLLPASAVSVPTAPERAPDVVSFRSGVSPTVSPAAQHAAEPTEQSLPQLQWPSVSEGVERGVRTSWAACSLGLLLALVWSSLRLRRDRRGWKVKLIGETQVLVSDGFGPAIVGLSRPAIVVPPWVLETDATTQGAILLHEEEHRRAGDQWLLMASFGALVLAPWNVAVWLMARRLARAIEWDCDERVLSHGMADVDYANVLLNAWQRTRRSGPWVPSPALAEHVSRLGRRVEHLMRPTPRRRAMKTIAGVCASVLLLGAATLVPVPQQAQAAAALVTAQPVRVTARAAASGTAAVNTMTAAAPTQARKSPRRTSTTSETVATDSIANTPRVTVTAQTQSTAPLQRARIALIAPFDAAGTSWIQTVNEQLAADARGHALYVIQPQEIKSFLTASGFSVASPLADGDLRALGTIIRADLIVSVTLASTSAGYRMEAALGSGRGLGLRPLVQSEGSASTLADQLLRALRADSTYVRLRRPLAEVPVVAFKPAIVSPGSRGPAYPADLRASSVSGNVVARFVVDTNNRVDESTIAILASDRPQFSTAVIESLRSTKFLAAQRDGIKVRQQMQMGFRFIREGQQTIVLFVTDDVTLRKIREEFDARGSRAGVR